MLVANKPSPFVLGLLATTMLTQPAPAHAAPGDTVGPEFQVNSFTTGAQTDTVVAMDADGDFVVAWTDNAGLDGDSTGIFARLFDATGVAQGPEFQVNGFATGIQFRPAVAMDADGGFVVAWSDFGGLAADSGGVFARRFDAAGLAQGTEFQVNTFTLGSQILPSVAMDADGDFAVAWQSLGQDGDGYGIFARRYDAAGVALEPEFQVNTLTIGGQRFPAVAMDADGDFVVAWVDEYGQDGSLSGIFARRFDAAGAAPGPEVQVNTFATGDQLEPAVAMDADGDFVVAWTDDYGQDGSGRGVFARRYDIAGAPQGSEFQINSFATGDQLSPAVAMDVGGDVVVAWTDQAGQDGSSFGVFTQRFDAAGAPLGQEVQVNSFTADRQQFPSVAMDADSDFVVTWLSQDQDGNSDGVFAQRYAGVERVEGDFDGDGNADVLWRNAATGSTIIWLLAGTERRAAQSIGVVPLVWEVAGTGDFNGDGKADILWRHTGNGTTVLWQMDGFAKVDSASIGKPPLTWVIEQLRDTDGDGNSDIFWRNTTTGGTLVWRMNGFTKTIVGSPGAAAQPPWEVN